jgi:hypothetical protein
VFGLLLAGVEESFDERFVVLGDIIPSDDLEDPLIVQLALLKNIDEFFISFEILLHVSALLLQSLVLFNASDIYPLFDQFLPLQLNFVYLAVELRIDIFQKSLDHFGSLERQSSFLMVLGIKNRKGVDVGTKEGIVSQGGSSSCRKSCDCLHLLLALIIIELKLRVGRTGILI